MVYAKKSSQGFSCQQGQHEQVMWFAKQQQKQKPHNQPTKQTNKTPNLLRPDQEK